MAYLKTVNPEARPSISDLEVDRKYTNVSSAATTDIKDGPGRLHAIIVNGGTLTGTITVYDERGSATTNKIATIAANQVVGYEFLYECNFIRGLRITASANVDITIIWT